MRQEKLVIFCSDIETDLDRVRASLEEVFQRLDLEGAQLRTVGAPEELKDAGWMALTLRRPKVGRACVAAALAPHLVAITHGVAKALREEALAVFVDPVAGKARACLHGEGGFPRLVEGAPFHVIRQASSWLEVDSNLLERYFSAYARKQAGAGPVDLTDVLPRVDEPRPEKDEEDRFVDAKLKLARELMDRYRRK